ncbi:CHAT domain-containing protein [uncultured Lacinutrix sp.]|uniref:CHAT domain-containing protein n=1 Tax=uncultured Lacinutrix sp. TaxID=574032 RepID=UPI0026084D4C|nr:CHAT domain-containing protein [uncultured Lacinutrix sp.]
MIYAQGISSAKCDSILKLNSLTKLQKVRAIEEIINQVADDDIELSFIYHDLSKYLFLKKIDIEKAILYAKNASVIRKKYYKEYPSFFKASFNNYAKFQYENGNYLDALKTCDSLLGFCSKTEERRAKVNWLKARIYEAKGDFKNALNSYAISEAIYKNNGNYKKLLSIYKNISAIYAILSDEKYKNAFFDNNNKIKVLAERYSIPKEQVIGLKLNIGHFYDTLKEYDLSLKSYNEALELSFELEDSLSISKGLNNVGVVYKKTNNIDKAANSFKAALKYSKGISIQRAKVYDNIGDIQLIKKEYKKALQLYHKSICLITYGTNEDYKSLPNYKEIELSTKKIDILDYLKDKANAWVQLYKTEFNSEDLKKALKTIALADKVVDLIYFESRADISKLFWREKGADLYQKAIEVSYLLDLPERVFYFTEKSKALLLLENVTNINAKTLAGLPGDIVEKETKLLEEINSCRQKIIQVSKVDVKEKKRLENTFFSKKNHYNKFIDSLELVFPKYHNLKKGIQIYDAKMTQKHLNEKQLVLQYKIDEKQSYVSLISKKKISVYKIEESNLLKSRIARFQECLKKPFLNLDDQEYFKKNALELYKQLFPFDENDPSIIENKQLLIIQDGILQNIPFEPLIVKNNNQPINELFMLNFNTISYAYSFSSLISSSKIKRKYANDYLIMSPTYFKKELGLLPLIISKNEVRSLEKELYTEALINEKATKQKFKESYGDHKVIHVSTHGMGSEKGKPWLAFYDDKLELDEMYFTNQYTDLVVLSACKTSRGELKKGEGVMSLARGFVNSGAQSVLASLWDIDQKSNNEIIYQFYKNLNEGQLKSEALNNAKLGYINKYKYTSEVSPYYWSAITLTGNDKAIFKKDKKIYRMFFLLVPIFLLYKYIKVRKNSA